MLNSILGKNIIHGMYVSLALCQINPLVGDIEGNYVKILSFIEKARIAGAKVICFPELALCGYPPGNLVLYKDFIEAQNEMIDRISKESSDCIVVLGYVSASGAIYNSAAVISNGKIFKYDKIHLKRYDDLDETIYFSSGKKFPIFATKDGFKFCVTICEDMWYQGGPLEYLPADVHLIINISASPYHVLRPRLREDMLRIRAIDRSAPVAFCNLVGGQDEFVFDGTSCLISRHGETLARAPSFKEHILLVDVPVEPYIKSFHRHLMKSDLYEYEVKEIDIEVSSGLKAAPGEKYNLFELLDEDREILSAIVLGTRDYAIKNKFSSMLVALSGGIDSSLVACIAAETVGPQNVLGVSMPSQFSSDHSKEDAEILAKNLGIKFHRIPINDIYNKFMDELNFMFSGTKFSTAEENLQARIRSNLIMTISNKFSYLVLACGNKSELSVGYATLYGDLAGGFAPIKDLYKTDVYRLAQYYNKMKGSEIIPRRVFEKPPSAELRPGQKDEEDLLPYSILDRVLKLYVDEKLSPSAISSIAKVDLFTVIKIIRMVENAEYKRRQAPPGVRISSKPFTRTGKAPITKSLGYLETPR